MGNQRRTEQRNDRITLAVLAMVPERKDAKIGQKCGGAGEGPEGCFLHSCKIPGRFAFTYYFQPSEVRSGPVGLAKILEFQGKHLFLRRIRTLRNLHFSKLVI